MKLHHIRDFLAVVEKGSMRAAAKQLGLGQPALSRSIRDLEQEIGVPLVERHARGVNITAMGEQFARRAGAASQELRRAVDELHQMQGNMQGQVVACLSSLAHVMLLPSVLGPFRKRYAQVELRIIEGVYPVIERRLLDGSVDFYLGAAPPAGDIAAALRQEKLLDNQRIVLARKNHPRRHATSLSELVAADWITTSITRDPQAEFADLFARHNLPAPRLALYAESLLTWLIALTSTDFIAISPRQFETMKILSRELVRIPVKETLSSPPLMLIQRSSLPLTPAAEYFADLLRAASLEYRQEGDVLQGFDADLRRHTLIVPRPGAAK